jgi:hypothetical protein
LFVPVSTAYVPGEDPVGDDKGAGEATPLVPGAAQAAARNGIAMIDSNLCISAPSGSMRHLGVALVSCPGRATVFDGSIAARISIRPRACPAPRAGGFDVRPSRPRPRESVGERGARMVVSESGVCAAERE